MYLSFLMHIPYFFASHPFLPSSPIPSFLPLSFHLFLYLPPSPPISHPASSLFLHIPSSPLPNPSSLFLTLFPFLPPTSPTPSCLPSASRLAFQRVGRSQHPSELHMIFPLQFGDGARWPASPCLGIHAATSLHALTNITTFLVPKTE